MLGVFGKHLADAGHDVTVVTGPPSYNSAYVGPAVPRIESVGGVGIRRLRVPGANTATGKIIGSALFPAAVLWHILTRRRAYDVISVTTIPPVVMGLTGLLGRLRSRRTRVVYHCMDLYPEAALSLGLLNDGRLARIATRLDRLTVQNATQVIVLSDEMRETLLERSVSAANIGVCNNFILKDRSEAAQVVEDIGIERRWLVFAGNLGRFQGLESLCKAIRILADERDDFEIVFLGAGRLSGWLESLTGEGLPVRVLPFRPLPEAMAVIAQADGAIVSLSPGVSRAAFPSKLLMNLELGRPILGVVEPQSDLARLIKTHDLGLSADPKYPDKVAQVLGQFLDRVSDWDPRQIRNVGHQLFGREDILAKWSRLYGLGET